MKWFKHDSSAHNDEKIRHLIHEFGVEGYGVYMICLELIAEKIDSNLSPEITINRRVLSEKLCMKSFRVERILRSSSLRALLVVTSTRYEFKMVCPNLLKRLDNWTKNSQVTNKQVSINEKQNENKNEKENKKNTPAGSLNKHQEKQVRSNLATKLNHEPDSEANTVALKELVDGVAKDLSVKNPVAVAFHRSKVVR